MDVVESKSPDAPDVAILTVRGRLDGTSAEAFGERLLSRIDGGERFFILDLAGLEYVSSVGLRALAMAAKQVTPLGGKIVLCAPPPRVQRVFQIAGFPTILTTVETQEDALACIHPRG